MKMAAGAIIGGVIAVLILAVLFFSIGCEVVFAKDTSIEKGKILKSFISEDASLNGFALSLDDCVSVKNKKNSFTLDEKKITWSASIRGGYMTHNTNDYSVFWYSPDGSLFEKQTPKQIFTDCSGLKTSLMIDREKMTGRMGLWKAEVVYKGVLIDNKYFYLLESGSKDAVREEMDELDARIVRPEHVSKTVEDAEAIRGVKAKEAEEAKNIELTAKITADTVNAEKAAVLQESYFETYGRDRDVFTDIAGIDHVTYGTEKIYWIGKFTLFFGVGSPDVEIFWLAPGKRIAYSDSTNFPGDSVSFNIKSDNISKDMIGEWAAIVYVNKTKILEKKFILDTEDNIKILESKKRQEEEKIGQEKLKAMSEKGMLTKEEVRELSKIITEKHESITGKRIREARKAYPDAVQKGIKIGDGEEYLIAARGKPDIMLLRKDGIEIWCYWKQDLWGNARSTNYAVQGNLVGGILSEMYSTGTLTKVFVEDGAIIEKTTEDNVNRSHIR